YLCLCRDLTTGTRDLHSFPTRRSSDLGKLTLEERQTMQLHAEIGHQVLANSDAELLRLGAVLALTHHERYDGRGYPRGLTGEERSEEHTSELQSRVDLVCRLLLENKNT